jgi:transcriptional regulator with XRE-family HTH domain
MGVKFNTVMTWSRVSGVAIVKVTGAQIRAARAFLKWSISSLAEQAAVGISTIQKIENLDGDAGIESDLAWRSEARREALEKLVAALERAGITFLPTTAQGPGIRGKIEGERM